MSQLWDVGKTELIKVVKDSSTEGALPADLCLALKYKKDDVEESLIAYADCGGNSAAKGMVIGTLLISEVITNKLYSSDGSLIAVVVVVVGDSSSSSLFK
jgi:hypothetical protein